MLLVSIELIDSALIDPRSRVLQLLARVHYQVHVHVLVRTVHVVHACKYGRESWIVYGDTTRHSSMLLQQIAKQNCEPIQRQSISLDLMVDSGLLHSDRIPTDTSYMHVVPN